MNETRVIILTSWRSQWFSYLSQELVDIAGEKLISRTMRQLHGLGQKDVIVATQQKEIARLITDSWQPDDPPGYAATLLQSASAWSDRTYILWGNTVWEDSGLKAVFADTKPVGFYGNYCTVYAFAFDEEYHDAIKDAAQRLIRGRGIGGFMWDMYHSYIGKPQSAEYGRHWNYDVFTVIPSVGTPADAKGKAFTTRIEHPGDYNKFLLRHEWARTKDNWPIRKGRGIPPDLQEYLRTATWRPGTSPKGNR
jgi:hypothetical protein